MSAEFVEKSDVAEYSTDEVEAMDAAEGTATTLGLVGDWGGEVRDKDVLLTLAGDWGGEAVRASDVSALGEPGW